MTSGESGSFEGMVIVPTLVFDKVGRKETWKVQVLPGLMVLPEQLVLACHHCELSRVGFPRYDGSHNEIGNAFRRRILDRKGGGGLFPDLYVPEVLIGRGDDHGRRFGEGCGHRDIAGHGNVAG